MDLQRRIEVLNSLGRQLETVVRTGDESFRSMAVQAYLKNNWFTRENIEKAMLEWATVLTNEKIREWIGVYDLRNLLKPRTIAVINAGNIPLVGMHDMISVYICGDSYTGKNASEDNLILPYIARLLTEIDPQSATQIQFTERLTKYDAVIATGSNNSARYFESYFKNVPHMIRKNRNGVGVLDGSESKEELEFLGQDIFQYFGLGCRNVSKLYVPDGYDFTPFFEAMFSFNAVMQHNKYMNNFEYNNAMLLMKQIPFLQNGFLIIREEERIASPVSVVHYEKYSGTEMLAKKLDSLEEQIQCVVAKGKLSLESKLKNRLVKRGSTQSPALKDYADGADTIQFLLSF